MNRLSRTVSIHLSLAALIASLLSAEQFRTLQSFVCTETVQHYRNGQHVGTYSYRVSFEDGHESYTPKVARLETWSEGEYGSLIRTTEELAAGSVQPGMQYLEFETKPGMKPWVYWQSGRRYDLGIRAYVQFDEAGRMYSVTWRAKDLPVALHLRQLEWRVLLAPLDYSDILVPASGSFDVQTADGSDFRNEFQFDNYQHYGAESRILTAASIMSEQPGMETMQR